MAGRPLEQVQAKLLAVMRQDSASRPRLPAAKVSPGGTVVAIGGPKPNPFRRETSAFHVEKGIRPLTREMQLEGVLPFVESTASLPRPRSSGELLSSCGSSAPSMLRDATLQQRNAKLLASTPLSTYAQLQHDASQKVSRRMQHPTFEIADASGLRVSKHRVGQRQTSHSDLVAAQSIPATAPSNRSEAVRLSALLGSLIDAKNGGWQQLVDVHDQTFAEAILQVANHCSERGELLQKIRKFYHLVVTMERDSSEKAREAQEEVRNRLADLEAEKERANDLEEKFSVASEKLDMLRATMVRLQMLRAIHTRKIQNMTRRCKELEWENEALQKQLHDDDSFKEHDHHKSRDHLSASVLAAGDAHSDPTVRDSFRTVASQREQNSFNKGKAAALLATDSLTAQLDTLKRMLASREAEIDALREGKLAAEAGLRAAEQEVRALMAGFAQSSTETGGGAGAAGPRRPSIAGQLGTRRPAVTATPGDYEPPGGYASPDTGADTGGHHQVGYTAPSAAHAGYSTVGACNLGDPFSSSTRGIAGSEAKSAAQGLYSGAPQDELSLLRQENKKLKASLRWTRAALAAKSSPERPRSPSPHADASPRKHDGEVGSSDEEDMRVRHSGKGIKKSDGGRKQTNKKKVNKNSKAEHIDGSEVSSQVSSQDKAGGDGIGARRRKSSVRSEGGQDQMSDDGLHHAVDDGIHAVGDGIHTGKTMHEAHSDCHNGQHSAASRGDTEASSRPHDGSEPVGESKKTVGRRGSVVMHRGLSFNQHDHATPANVAGASALDEKPPKIRRRRDKPMITHLRGAKAIPQWMSFKASGSLMQARVEYEQELEKRGEDDDKQDIGEFVEDRYVELYGKGKLATDNLRDLIKSIKIGSELHRRLNLFRRLTCLVPKDDELGIAVSEECALFYRMALRMLVDVITEDHLSGLKGSAFWTHYSRSDLLKVPVHYLEKVGERVGKSAKRKTSHGSTKNLLAAPQSKAEKEKEKIAFRGMKTVEMALADFAQGNLDETGQIRVTEDMPPAKVVEVGEFPNKKVKRVDLDAFFERAFEKWNALEDTEEDMLLHAYGSWDHNEDGQLQLAEFTEMVLFANPGVNQRKITRAFISASEDNAGEVIDKDKLAKVMLVYGFSLKEQPPGYVAPVREDPAEPGAALAQTSTSSEAQQSKAADGSPWKSVNAGMAQIFAMTKAINAMQRDGRLITEAAVWAEAAL